uniref:Tudor domain-containing protein n=1 Tax=Panagrellus redivivus TaxID=6233 RepID=A0A7E4V5N8_PANRE
MKCVKIHSRNSANVVLVEPSEDGSLLYDDIASPLNRLIKALVFKHDKRIRLIKPKQGRFMPPPKGWFEGTVTAICEMDMMLNRSIEPSSCTVDPKSLETRYPIVSPESTVRASTRNYNSAFVAPRLLPGFLHWFSVFNVTSIHSFRTLPEFSLLNHVTPVIETNFEHTLDRIIVMFAPFAHVFKAESWSVVKLMLFQGRMTSVRIAKNLIYDVNCSDANCVFCQKAPLKEKATNFLQATMAMLYQPLTLHFVELLVVALRRIVIKNGRVVRRK